MIVDSSVLIAILRNETQAAGMIGAMAEADHPTLSAGTWVELGAVTSGDDPGIPARLRRLMTTFGIIIEPVSAEQAQIGHDAYQRYGKGHHRARLNFGDCFAYALAKATGEPLLFKGDDFNHTDLLLHPASSHPR